MEYVAINRSVHKHMCSELDQTGRDEALNGLFDVQNSSTLGFWKQRLYMSPIFIDLASAFLTIQDSSASCEGFLVMPGITQVTGGSMSKNIMTEVLLMIRSFVMSQVENRVLQNVIS